MENIKFSKEHQQEIVQKLQKYFDYELGQFDAGFLLDFMRENIGIYFYNQGVFDSQAILSKRIDDIQDAILQLEKFPIK